MITISLSPEDFWVSPFIDGASVVLRDSATGSGFPMLIGSHDATMILVELKCMVPPRPLTHDLTKNLLAGHGVMMKHAILTKLEAGTYYAVIVTEKDGVETETDARPSDAMALALRFGASILVADEFWAQMISDEQNQKAIELLEKLRQNPPEQR